MGSCISEIAVTVCLSLGTLSTRPSYISVTVRACRLLRSLAKCPSPLWSRCGVPGWQLEYGFCSPESSVSQPDPCTWGWMSRGVLDSALCVCPSHVHVSVILICCLSMQAEVKQHPPPPARHFCLGIKDLGQRWHGKWRSESTGGVREASAASDPAISTPAACAVWPYAAFRHC